MCLSRDSKIVQHVSALTGLKVGAGKDTASKRREHGWVNKDTECKETGGGLCGWEEVRGEQKISWGDRKRPGFSTQKRCAIMSCPHFAKSSDKHRC